MNTTDAAKLYRLKEALTKAAAEKGWDFDGDSTVDDFAAGNVDDAFAGGEGTGRRDLARELLALLDEET